MLSKAEKDYIIELLDKGETIPEDFKHKLFPIQHKEYELAYAGKMRKEDVLADEDGSFPVPLQIEKIYKAVHKYCTRHPSSHCSGGSPIAITGISPSALRLLFCCISHFCW